MKLLIKKHCVNFEIILFLLALYYSRIRTLIFFNLIMSVLKNNSLFSADKKLNDLSNIKEFINIANSRLDAISSITKNSHAIAADAVTAMICENQDSVNSKISLNTTNKMSVCLRDGEIILRIVAYLLISNDESVLEKSCLKDLKNTYLALGVPLRNARRVIELMRNATISDLNSTVNNMQGNKGFLPDLISETEFQFERIINLLN